MRAGTVNRPHGIEIPYVVLGDGPRRMLFAHSLLASGTGGIDVFQPLVDGGWTVIAMDQRGHGRATKVADPEGYALRELGGDLIAILDEVGWQSAWLAGGSMGAATSMAALELAPDRAEGLALLAPAVGRAVNPGVAVFAEIGTVFLEAGIDAGVAAWRAALARDGAPDSSFDDHEAKIRGMGAAATGAVLLALAGWSLPAAFAALSDLDGPTVVAAWKGDDVHPFSVAEDITTTARRGRLRTLDMATEGAPLAMFQVLTDEVAAAIAAVVA